MSQQSYALVSDLQNAYTDHDLIAISDEQNEMIITAKLDAALANASRQIDSYLQSRYTLPLSDVPAILVRICCDMAMYQMQSLRPLHDIEDARRRYEDARKDLSMIKDGKLALGPGATTMTTPTITSPSIVIDSEVTNTGRLFDRRKLRSF